MTEAQLVEAMAELRQELLRRGSKPKKGFSIKEATEFAESIYQSWRAGDTSSSHNWFMVRMDESDQDICHLRLAREREQDG